MRNGLTKGTVALALVGALAGAAVACGPPPRRTVALPGELRRGVIAGDQLAGITDGGRLVVVALPGGPPRDLGTLGVALASFIDARDGKALVASPGKLHTVDLATGKVMRSVGFAGDPRGLGFLDGDRAFVHTGAVVLIVDLAAGRTLHKVTLSGNDQRSWLTWLDWHHQVAGGRLYLAGDALHVIDPVQGKLVETIRGKSAWLGGLRVTDREAFVVDLLVGCGVGVRGVSRIDLRTKNATELKPGPAGEAAELLWEARARGATGRFVGAWRGRGVFCQGKTLTVGARLATLAAPAGAR